MNLFAKIASAASPGEAFGEAVSPILENIVDPIVMLIFAIALVVFVLGVFQMVWSTDPDSRKRGKWSIVGGVIGMFIMVSAYGLIRLILGTFGISGPSYLGF